MFCTSFHILYLIHFLFCDFWLFKTAHSEVFDDLTEFVLLKSSRFLIALTIPGNLIKHDHSRNADFVFILGLITNCSVSGLFSSIKLKVFTNMFSEHRCSMERNISQNLNFLLVYFMIQLPDFYGFF